MISMKLFSNIVKENLKRFWFLGLLYTVGIFFMSIFPILVMDPTRLHRFLDSLFLGELLPFYTVIVPILTVIVIFKYLHSSKGSSFMHGIPIRRRELYIGSLVSGLILVIAPVVLMYFTMILIKEPVFPNYGEPIDIFTFSNINYMLLNFISSTLLGYALSVFAVMVTGIILFQGIVSVGLYFLFPVLRMLVEVYYRRYFFGYFRTYLNYSNKIFDYMTPLTSVISRGDVDISIFFIHIIASLILFIISYFIYNIRPLEKTTDTIVFKPVIIIFKLLAVFVGMSVVGFIFFDITSNVLIQNISFIVGGILALIISEMIIQKTFLININFKKNILIVVSSLIFLVFVMTDISGIENKVFDIDEIEEVYITDSEVHYYGEFVYYNDDNIFEMMTELHKEIIENKEYIEAYTDNKVKIISIYYKLKNGKLINRRYVVPIELLHESLHYKELLEYDKYQLENAKLLNLDYNDIEILFVTSILNNQNNYLTFNEEEIESFLTALEKDIINETYEEILKPYRGVATMSLEFSESKLYQPYITIKTSYINTIKWLKDKDLYKDLILDNDKIHELTITKINKELKGSYEESTKEPDKDMILKLTESDDINEVMEHFYDSNNVFCEADYSVNIIIEDYGESYINGFLDKSNPSDVVEKYFSEME